jgi:hypothetical protein
MIQIQTHSKWVECYKLQSKSLYHYQAIPASVPNPCSVHEVESKVSVISYWIQYKMVQSINLHVWLNRITLQLNDNTHKRQKKILPLSIWEFCNITIYDILEKNVCISWKCFALITTWWLRKTACVRQTAMKERFFGQAMCYKRSETKRGGR